MAFQFNSTDLGILPDDPGKSIGDHYYLLVMSRKIQKYMSSYYINLDISKNMNWRGKKYEKEVKLMGKILGEDGRVSGKVTSSPSSKTQSLPTEKTNPHCIPPVDV